MAKEKKYKLHFPNYTPIEEAVPDKGRMVMTQIDYDDGKRTSMVICKIADDGTFMYGNPLKPLTSLEGVHITGWKYLEYI